FLNWGQYNKPIIFSSDFIRAYETSMIVANEINLPIKAIQQSELLRDRYFGDYDGKSVDNYFHIWREDPNSPDYAENSAESVLAVLERTTKLIFNLEKKHDRREIILVSHGDPLSILETVFRRVEPAKFRSLAKLENAEIRLLVS
ncbi:MAG: histidine phosphatase family protein, partial [Candidatus Nanoarchaeia archaeon]|nr:histidine phosphatase family protein [Candidatus Nanoarchaeia archaeon]